MKKLTYGGCNEEIDTFAVSGGKMAVSKVCGGL